MTGSEPGAFTCESGTFSPCSCPPPVATPTPVLVFWLEQRPFHPGGNKRKFFHLDDSRGCVASPSLGGDAIKPPAKPFSCVLIAPERELSNHHAAACTSHTLLSHTDVFKQRDNGENSHSHGSDFVYALVVNLVCVMRRTNGWIQCGDTHAYTHSNEA